MLLGLAIGLALVHWPVTTRQGINGQVFVRRIPLWVKVAEFLVRDHHYRNLARTITASAEGPQEKVLAIFEWTRTHLRHQPPELPMVDDHVYSIIVRGYGTSDQFADVFTTLCTSAGIPGTIDRVSEPSGDHLYLAMVQLNGSWYPLDPYRGVYFQHEDGRLVSLEELIKDPSLLVTTRCGVPVPEVEYEQFIHLGLEEGFRSLRPANQIPWKRLWQELVRGFRIIS